jgi:hypothetical protein
MAFRRDRVKPTPYPFLPFHITRSAQLLSSIVVASIMFYFLSSLSTSHHSLPWTFILVRTPLIHPINQTDLPNSFLPFRF